MIMSSFYTVPKLLLDDNFVSLTSGQRSEAGQRRRKPCLKIRCNSSPSSVIRELHSQTKAHSDPEPHLTLTVSHSSLWPTVRWACQHKNEHESTFATKSHMVHLRAKENPLLQCALIAVEVLLTQGLVPGPTTSACLRIQPSTELKSLPNFIHPEPVSSSRTPGNLHVKLPTVLRNTNGRGCPTTQTEKLVHHSHTETSGESQGRYRWETAKYT